MSSQTPNALIHESSPYLLQHAYNPVNWLPFGDAAFEQARKENKPVLVSIGYSACHWCHVMEHESFEDLEVAALMNAQFINIKVDREERSDVDMLYMQAVQLMTGQGGWPLNCFVMPDGRPFYGGTYFRKDQWLNILTNLAGIYQNEHEKVEAYASKLTEGIRQSELLVTSPAHKKVLSRPMLKEAVARWKQLMDPENGGLNRAPKFPMPSNYLFLLRYSALEHDRQLEELVHLTLRKMSLGGIYDQLHGGFARYSTDMLWKVPHFEKMLYDNAQLSLLYTEAYAISKNALYKETAMGILQFVESEWLQEEGAFYSALDADSDGEEGKYYVWNKTDLEDLLGEHFAVFSEYFEINEKGYWEQGNYILMRSENSSAIALKYGITEQALSNTIQICKRLLIQESKSRLKPGLDDKIITAWNAMMCSAFAKAHLIFDVPQYKERALNAMNFILQKLTDEKGQLKRTYKKGHAKIDAFLDDYAFTIDALINTYLISQDFRYLDKAALLCEQTLREFNNPDSVYLYYTTDKMALSVARNTEVGDNVIPASNSQMALNLFTLAHHLHKPEWKKRAEDMLDGVSEELQHYASGYSNWACLALQVIYPLNEVIIVGNHVDEKLRELSQHGVTNTILAVAKEPSNRPLLKNRYVEHKTLVYVCENNTCKVPVETVHEALLQLA